MITQETAAHIWDCYREIAAGKKLLEDMQKGAQENEEDDRTAPSLRDAFGRKRHLQLGIPSGQNGHRLLNVAPDLAESVIRAHIANQEAELVTVNEQARIELMGEPTP